MVILFNFCTFYATIFKHAEMLEYCFSKKKKKPPQNSTIDYLKEKFKNKNEKKPQLHVTHDISNKVQFPVYLSAESHR